MSGLSIGQIARQAGLRSSAIRYYEAQGLIPKAARRAGRRIYDADIRDHLLFVRLAIGAGFRISEIKPLVAGMTIRTKPGERWRSVAERKLGELDREIQTLESKKRCWNRSRNANAAVWLNSPARRGPESPDATRCLNASEFLLHLTLRTGNQRTRC